MVDLLRELPEGRPLTIPRSRPRPRDDDDAVPLVGWVGVALAVAAGVLWALVG